MVDSHAMSLSAKLAFQIDKRVQLKGLGLFEAGAVRVIDENDDRFSARVRGGSDYRVELQLTQSDLGYYCECPFHSEWGTCKHVWAAILEAERRGALRLADSVPRLHFEPLYEEDLPEFTDLLAGLTRPVPAAARYQIPPPKQVPAWEQYLDSIRGSMDYSRRQPVKWGKDFEVWYAIDVPGSRFASAIVIDLLSRSRKKSGEWTVFKPFRPTAAQVG